VITTSTSTTTTTIIIIVIIEQYYRLRCGTFDATTFKSCKLMRGCYIHDACIIYHTYYYNVCAHTRTAEQMWLIGVCFFSPAHTYTYCMYLYVYIVCTYMYVYICPSHMYNVLFTRIILCIHRCRIHTHSLQRSRRVLYLNLRGVKMANKKTGPH